MPRLRTAETSEIVDWLRVLANRHRLEILVRLTGACPPGAPGCSHEEMRACVGDIATGLGIAQPTVSHHLKELRQAGLIRMTRRGTSMECAATAEPIAALAAFFATMAQSAAEPGGKAGRGSRAGSRAARRGANAR